MAYNIRAKLKIRGMGDTKPVVHTFFTSDEVEPADAKANFERDNPGARDVELFRADKPCKATDFSKLMAAAEAEDKIPLAPAPLLDAAASPEVAKG